MVLIHQTIPDRFTTAYFPSLQNANGRRGCRHMRLKEVKQSRSKTSLDLLPRATDQTTQQRKSRNEQFKKEAFDK
jgi:hypothetical protein